MCSGVRGIGLGDLAEEPQEFLVPVQRLAVSPACFYLWKPIQALVDLSIDFTDLLLESSRILGQTESKVQVFDLPEVPESPLE